MSSLFRRNSSIADARGNDDQFDFATLSLGRCAAEVQTVQIKLTHYRTLWGLGGGGATGDLNAGQLHDNSCRGYIALEKFGCHDVQKLPWTLV